MEEKKMLVDKGGVLDLCPEFFKTRDIVRALQDQYFNLTDMEFLKVALEIRKNQIEVEKMKKRGN